jgi:hypothetical protein
VYLPGDFCTNKNVLKSFHPSENLGPDWELSNPTIKSQISTGSRFGSTTVVNRKKRFTLGLAVKMT